MKAPLGKRLEAGGYPATVAVENISAGYHTPARKRSLGGAIHRRTRPICSRAVSQKWASRPFMLQTPNTRCSGRSFWRQPDFDKFRVIQEHDPEECERISGRGMPKDFASR